MSAPEGNAKELPPPGEISRVVEHLFRQEAARMVATLTRIFGWEHLTLAEDVVQEALVRALQTWPYYGLPRNPAGWIMQVSRNLALDILRREKVFRDKMPELTALIPTAPREQESVLLEDEIRDDRLRMMFVCCHPLVPQEAQVALALKTLCGFSAAEISHAFFTTEAAIAKRLTRAAKKIRDARILFEIPAGPELSARLDGVLQTLYLLFNEGYKASSGEKLVREDLSSEAIRLAGLLAEHPAGDHPKTHALLALMLFNAARFPSRTDLEGNLLRLAQQDRSRWNQTMISQGLYHFARSAAGGELSEYHLQAGVAACHCTAVDYESTDWPRILALYDHLATVNHSAVIALNRAVAVGHVHGPAAALSALEPLADGPTLDSYYLFHAVKGELEARQGNFSAALANFRKSLPLTPLKSEQSFLSKRIEECQERQKN